MEMESLPSECPRPFGILRQGPAKGPRLACPTLPSLLYVTLANLLPSPCLSFPSHLSEVVIISRVCALDSLESWWSPV